MDDSNVKRLLAKLDTLPEKPRIYGNTFNREPLAWSRQDLLCYLHEARDALRLPQYDVVIGPSTTEGEAGAHARLMDGWRESANDSAVSSKAAAERHSGKSYIIGCVIKTRGEELAHFESGDLCKVGLESYAIWPLEKVVFIPSRLTLRQRIGLWIAGMASRAVMEV